MYEKLRTDRKFKSNPIYSTWGTKMAYNPETKMLYIGIDKGKIQRYDLWALLGSDKRICNYEGGYMVNDAKRGFYEIGKKSKWSNDIRSFGYYEEVKEDVDFIVKKVVAPRDFSFLVTYDDENNVYYNVF